MEANLRYRPVKDEISWTNDLGDAIKKLIPGIYLPLTYYIEQEQYHEESIGVGNSVSEVARLETRSGFRTFVIIYGSDWLMWKINIQ